MNEIEAFILAGGASSRMGTDKARLILNGSTFVQHIARTLRAFSSTVTIVGQHSEDLGLKSIDDIHPRWGALGGIQTALNHCKAEWAFVVACDLPFVTVELCRRLSTFRSEHEAVVPIQSDLVPQPLCAFYKVDPCLDQATQLIASGLRRPLDLLQKVKTKWVAFRDLEDLPESDRFFVNINTPSDYDDVNRKLGAGEI